MIRRNIFTQWISFDRMCWVSATGGYLRFNDTVFGETKALFIHLGRREKNKHEVDASAGLMSPLKKYGQIHFVIL
jgi:hypothetical protein